MLRVVAAWLVLTTLGLSIDLIKSANGLIEQGGASYMLVYAALRAPQVMVTLFPISILVGAAATFMVINNRSELVMMRAAGSGIFTLLKLLLPLSLILGVFYSQLGDRVDAWAEAQLAAAFPETADTASVGSWLWTRDSTQVIRARLGTEDGTELTDLTVYEMDQNGQITARMTAQKAKFINARWLLDDATRTKDSKTVKHAQIPWDTRLVPESVREVAGKGRTVSADKARAALSGLTVLTRGNAYYVTRIARSYSAIFLPLVMLTIAAIAGFGNSRIGNGARPAALAVALGFIYLAADSLFGSLGEVGAMGPAVAAFAPSIFFAIAGAWGLLLLEG